MDIFCNSDIKKRNIIIKNYVSNETYENSVHNIFIDDTLDFVNKKISLYCTKYKIGSEYVFSWIESNDNIYPLTFQYEDKNVKIENPYTLNEIIDSLFFKTKPINKQYVDLNNLLLETRCEQNEITIYFIYLTDLLNKFNINDNIKYNKSNWPLNITIDEFYYGFIIKYWPNVSLKNITNHTKINSYNKTKDMIEDHIEKINLINEYKDTNTLIKCDNLNFNFFKIGLYESDDLEKNINILELYKKIKLNDTIPFIKLVLSDYRDSYYKLYKPIINKKINKLFINFWIKDFKQGEDYSYNSYMTSTNVLIVKIYEKKRYCSLLLYKNGKIEIIFESTRLKNKDTLQYEYTNEPFDKQTIKLLIDKCNKFINKNKDNLDFKLKHKFTEDFYDNNYKNTKVDVLNITFDLKRFDWNKKIIKYVFDNLYIYNRIIDEKYYYNVKSGNIMYLRYKRVDNYNSQDTIDSILSTLHNPNLGLSDKPDLIIEKIKKRFDLSLEEATEKYNEWKIMAELKINDNKKYYTIRSYSEPGPEINIIQNIGGVNTIVQVNGISGINELNRIIYFLKTTFSIYDTYLTNKSKLGKYIVFCEVDKKSNKIKKQNEKYEKQTHADDIYTGINDYVEDIDDIYEEGEVQLDDFGIGEINLDDLSDEELDMLGGSKKTDITRYTMRRLTDSNYDPNLFKFKPIQKQPNGSDITYPKICQGASRRQPIVLTKQEFDKINENKDEEGNELYSGPDSYGNYKIYSSKKGKEFYYICPKYWDIERNISLDPEKKELWSKDHEIIDEKKNTGIVDGTVYDKKGNSQYWRGKKLKKGETLNTNELTPEQSKYYIVQDLPDGYRSDNIKMPCCFTNTKKQIDKETVLTAPKVEGKKSFIPYKLPSKENIFGYLHQDIEKFINQNSEIYLKEDYIINAIKKIKELEKNLDVNISKIEQIIKTGVYDGKGFDKIKTYGFLKIGVKNNASESLFYSLSYILDINYEDFIKQLTNISVELYQCTNLYNLFKKNTDDINETDLNLFYNYVNGDIEKKENVYELYKLFINMKHKQELVYKLNLIISYHNFIKYINDTKEFKLDDYFYNIIENLYGINMIIFEDINNTIRLKKPPSNVNDRSKYIFLIKRGVYYEPIVFKYEEKIKNDKYNSDKYNKLSKNSINILNRYDKNYNTHKTIKIFDKNYTDTSIEEDCLKFFNKNISFINKDYFIKTEKNLNDIFKSVKNLKFIVFDNLNNISHLINKQHFIIPIQPILPQYYKQNKQFYSLTDKFKKNIKYSLETITRITSANIYNDYKQLLKSYNNDILNSKITGVIVNLENKIVNLLVNNNYIPLNPIIDYKSINETIDIKGTTDIREIDKNISLNYINYNTNEQLYNKYYDLETYLNNLFNDIMIKTIKSRKNLKDTLEKIIVFDIKTPYEKKLELIKNHIVNIVKTTKYITSIYNYKSADNIKSNTKNVKKTKSAPTKLNNYQNPELYLNYNKQKNVLESNGIPENNLLLIKFSYKFSEMLLINNNDLSNLVNYNFNDYELKINEKDCISFSYDEINDIIDTLFNIKNKYINYLYME